MDAEQFWRWMRHDNGVHYVLSGHEPFTREICVIYSDDGKHSRLIASAPKMLAALKAVVSALPPHLTEIAMAAIVSAEGKHQ